MIPTWLLRVLDEHIAMQAGERERLAEAIIEALPKELIVAAIDESAHTVLKQRGIIEGGEIASEIGRNAAHGVIVRLEAGE